MIVTCVYIHVKPEELDNFIKAARANHIESVKEHGNLRFDLIQKADDQCSFMLYEAYESEEVAANHKTTSHYFTWRESVKDFMTEPRVGVKYNIIEPSNPEKW